MRRADLPCSSGMAPALLAMLALAGCGDRFPPPPTLTGVTPASGQVDQTQPLQINGTGFAVRVFANFNDPNQNATDDTYAVKIGGIALTGIQHVSTEELTGTLPPGVAQGDNDLEVTDPWSRTVVLPAAYFGIPIGGVPTQLSISTSLDVLPIGACQPVTVTQLNAGGTATVSQTATAVALDTNPAGAFGLFSDSGCTAAITSANIAAGQTSVTLYAGATDRATADLEASATGLTGAAHTFVFGPTQLAFATSAVQANVNSCFNAPLTIETRDPNGAASNVATPTTVTLSASPNLALYTDSACMGSTVSSIVIPANGSSASFFIKGLATGTYTITVSSSGFSGTAQAETINNPTIFVFSTVGPQGTYTPFPVTIEAQDGFGNVVTGFTGNAQLSGVGGPAAECLYNCLNGTTTGPFTRGGWSGWVQLDGAASSAQVHASNAVGTIQGDSNAFQVYAPDTTFGAPTARLLVYPGAVNNTGDPVTLDAHLSSDYNQGPLEFSFDKDGTAGTAPGVFPWTNWQGPTYIATGYATGLWQARVAVRKQGGTTIAYASATVAATSSTFCVVNTTSMVNDGASNCTMTNKAGTDQLISLPEAIALTNGGANRAITTNSPMRFVFDPAHPLPAVNSATWISFASGTQLVGNPLPLNGNGAVLANADLSGNAAWNATSNATIQDSVIRDGASLSTNGSLTLSRVLAFNCPAGSPCARNSGTAGTLRVLFSQFLDAPGGALQVSSGSCAVNAVDVLGSTFTRTATGIRDDCTSASSSHVLHATFHGGGTGVSYAGGSGHVLEDSIFSSEANATSCGSATFATRDFNLLFGNTSDGCLSTSDPNTLSGDPAYFLPEIGDLRDRSTSPARDSAADAGLDVNGNAPGLFFNAGPDRGGHETP